MRISSKVAALRRALDAPDHPRRELRQVARLFTEQRFGSGSVLCREGEWGREAYLVVEGRGTVTIDDKPINMVVRGDFVGEMALLNEAPRSATVTAHTPMHVLTIDKVRFTVLTEQPLVMDRIREGLASRTTPKGRPSRRKKAPGRTDPEAWQSLLYAARRDRIRRRRRRRATLTAAFLVLAVIAGVGIRSLANRSTPVPLEEAVARFRDAASASAAAPSGVAQPQAAIVESGGPLGSVASGPAPVEQAQPNAAEGAQEEAATAPTTGPEAGVYVYATRGFEEVTLFGGSRHTYPDQTTMTVRATACGADLRWDGLSERWDESSVCLVDRSIEVTAYQTYHEFYGQKDMRTFTCTPGTVIRPRDEEPGATFSGRCADNRDSTVDIAGTVVGIEQVIIEGTVVDALRVQTDETLSGGTGGSRTTDTWFAMDTGMVLRRSTKTNADAHTVAGSTRYREELWLELTSLSPLR